MQCLPSSPGFQRFFALSGFHVAMLHVSRAPCSGPAGRSNFDASSTCCVRATSCCTSLLLSPVQGSVPPWSFSIMILLLIKQGGLQAYPCMPCAFITICLSPLICASTSWQQLSARGKTVLRGSWGVKGMLLCFVIFWGPFASWWLTFVKVQWNELSPIL